MLGRDLGVGVLAGHDDDPSPDRFDEGGVVGPFGAALQALPDDTIGGGTAGHVDLLGVSEDAVHIERRRYVPVPLIYKDFSLFWRDLEASREAVRNEDAY